MTDNFDDFIDRVKSKVDIGDVVESCGFSLRRDGGGNFRANSPKSLIVCPRYENYFHYGDEGTKGWTGDHITFVQTYGGRPDFMDALRFVADMAGEQMPEGVKIGGGSAAKGFRVRAEMWDLVCNWLQKKLWSAPAALTYATGRGWTNETIKKSRLGFTGVGGAGGGGTGKDDLRGELQMYEYDVLSPEVVAILGLKAERGEQGIRDWCQKYSVDFEALPESAQKGRIWGLLDFPRLVYPHIERGRVIYFSARNLKWEKEQLHSDPKHKSWNLPKVLVGERPRYKNFLFHKKAEIAIVAEGPADGITWAQWGYACECLVSAGVADDIVEDLRDVKQIFLGTDNGDVGRKAIDRLGGLLGPLPRVLTFPIPESAGEDANDWLQNMLNSGLIPPLVQPPLLPDQIPNRKNPSIKEQTRIAKLLLENADPYIFWITRELEGATALRKKYILDKVTKLAVQMSADDYDFHSKDLGKAIGKGVQWLNRIVKRLQRDADDEKKEKERIEREATETMGGWFSTSVDGSEGYLVEVIYDPNTDEALLAFRDPDGHIGTDEYLDIEGMRYVPWMDDNIRYGTVKLASELPNETMDVREMLAAIELYLREYFMLDKNEHYKMAALYALFTWVYDCFGVLPYIRARGGPGSGKSELMILLGRICYRMMSTAGLSSIAGYKGLAHLYKGTLFIDEVDRMLYGKTQEKGELSAFLNVRAMKEQARIITMMDVLKPDGTHTYRPTSTMVYGPTLMTMYRPFKDPATESRTVSFDLPKKTVRELKEAGYNIELLGAAPPPELLETAQNLRNMLLRWRLENWQRRIEVSSKVQLTDENVSPRVNQVMRPLKVLAYVQGNQEMLNEIQDIGKMSYEGEMNWAAASMEAAIFRGIVEVFEKPAYDKHFFTGSIKQYGTVKYIMASELTRLVNEYIDYENLGDGVEKKNQEAVKTITVNNNCRDYYKIPVERINKGMIVIRDLAALEDSKKRYGLDQIVEVKEVTTTEPEPVQTELL